MKKLILLLLFIPLVSSGQFDNFRQIEKKEKEIENTKKQDVVFGVKAGLNLSTIVTEGINYENRSSFHFGLTAEIKFNEKFSLQPEFLYSGQGFINKDSEGPAIGTVNLLGRTSNLNYLNLPVIAKFYVLNTFFLETGPQIGCLINNNNSNRDGWEYTVPKSNFKFFDYGFNIGASYKLNSVINFNLRYYRGLRNVFENPNDPGEKNKVLSFSIGYKI